MTSTLSEITLKGSVAIVTEFFGYAVNSILYQRGIYPPDAFQPQRHYGLAIMVTSDQGLTTYLSNVLGQIASWVETGKLQRLVLVVSSIATRETLERWTFNVEAEPPGKAGAHKSEKEVHAEIQAIIRQITASVTFLPLLDEPCSFDLLVYTASDAEVPLQWEESDPRYITNAAEVKLRSFSTRVHKVETAVSYKME